MPTVDFEVAATDCQLAGEILDVGIEAYTAARDSATAYNYICVGNASLSPSPSQIFLSFYIVGLISTLFGWAVLYRQGAPVEEFLKWGICCVVIPVFGPLIALLGFVNLPGGFGRFSVAGSLQEAGNRNADDPH